MGLETWVVKIGGSLTHTNFLTAWCHSLANSQNSDKRIFIVPGGGEFANQVRASQSAFAFNDRIAHEMAILATQQFGLLLAGIESSLNVIPKGIDPSKLSQTGCWVWLPEVGFLDVWGLGVGWQYTSDSMAACLAEQVSASNLFLVKSIDNVCLPHYELDDLTHQGVIDAGFSQNLFSEIRTWIYPSSQFDAFAKTLSGKEPLGFGGSQVKLRRNAVN